MRRRTKQFALRVVRLFRGLPRTGDAQVLGRQILRSGTPVGANYRAVCLARSRAEFLSKLGVVLEEADESVFWLELLVESEIVSSAKMQSLLDEANELVKIFGAARRTTRQGG